MAEGPKVTVAGLPGGHVVEENGVPKLPKMLHDDGNPVVGAIVTEY